MSKPEGKKMHSFKAPPRLASEGGGMVSHEVVIRMIGEGREASFIAVVEGLPVRVTGTDIKLVSDGAVDRLDQLFPIKWRDGWLVKVKPADAVGPLAGVEVEALDLGTTNHGQVHRTKPTTSFGRPVPAGPIRSGLPRLGLVEEETPHRAKAYAVLFESDPAELVVRIRAASAALALAVRTSLDQAAAGGGAGLIALAVNPFRTMLAVAVPPQEKASEPAA